MVSLGQVKEILDKTESENMDQIQRWTLDYVTKFSKTSPEESRKIVEELVDQC